MEKMCCLDREALGRLGFWREFRLAAKRKGRVRISTHKKAVTELPIDLKLLLKNVPDNDAGLGAVLGLSKPSRNSMPRLPIETMIILFTGIFTLMQIRLIRNLYKFNVSTTPDGTITIEAAPNGA